MYQFQSSSSLYNSKLSYSNLDLLLNRDKQTFETNHLQNPNSVPITQNFSIQPNFINLINTNYPLHYNQSNPINYSVQPQNDFLMHEGLMINQQVRAYHQTSQQYLNFQVQQQPSQVQPVTAAQQQRPRKPQRAKIQIKNGDEVLQVQLEKPFLTKGKPRLHWTRELHARFLRAAIELGGVSSATPRKILNRMNVRGVTVDQIKSHLQKVRLRNKNESRDGNRTNNSHTQVDTVDQSGLLETNEAQNNHQILEAESVDNYIFQLR